MTSDVIDHKCNPGHQRWVGDKLIQSATTNKGKSNS